MKNGKGYKTVTKYSRTGKKMGSVRKPIHETHAEQIKRGRFVPGLFSDCILGNKTRKIVPLSSPPKIIPLSRPTLMIRI